MKTIYFIKPFLILFITVLSFCVSTENMIQDRQNIASLDSLQDKAQTMLPALPELNGWGLNPEKIKKGQIDLTDVSQDWFYQKFQSKASARSIEVKSNSFMESTCKKKALEENKDNLIISAISSIDPSKKNLLKDFEDNKKNIEIFKCIGTGLNNPYSDCECFLSFKYIGGKVAMQKKISSQ